MTYIETCGCGARLEIKGWGIREVGQPVLSFRQAHARCRTAPRYRKPGPFESDNLASIYAARAARAYEPHAFVDSGDAGASSATSEQAGQ